MISTIEQLLADYQLPKVLGFGKELAPIMYRANCVNGEWQTGELQPFAPIPINPAATSLQFGQQCFEGMKAFAGKHDSPCLFRPEANWARFGRSAERLTMLPVPGEIFADALSQVTTALADFVPRGRGQSLYLRPTLLGLDPHFGVHGSDNLAFLLLASPSDAYYGSPISVMVERRDTRAAHGGTGATKVGGNYGASLQATRRCEAAGFDQPLWLDGQDREEVEELSAMNFAAIIDGALHTPPLAGTILPGITRDSILRLAPTLGIDAIERPMPVTRLIEAVQSGRCSEMFACGTGAIVCSITAIGEEDGTRYTVSGATSYADELKNAILDIQEGRAEDLFGWTVPANDPGALKARLAD